MRQLLMAAVAAFVLAGPAAGQPPRVVDIPEDAPAEIRSLLNEANRTIRAGTAGIAGQMARIWGHHLAFLDFSETCAEMSSRAHLLPGLREAYFTAIGWAQEGAPNATSIAQATRLDTLASIHAAPRARVCAAIVDMIVANNRDLTQHIDRRLASLGQ